MNVNPDQLPVAGTIQGTDRLIIQQTATSKTTVADLAAAIATPYTLPVATDIVLGGVKEGDNVTIDVDGAINVAAPYSLPIAGASLGGVKNGGNVTVGSDGAMNVAPSALDGIISGLGVSVTGLNLAVAVGSWRISGVTFQTLTETDITLANADPTNNRIDLVYANNAGAILVVAGVASINPVKPNLPANSIEVGFVLVTPGGAFATGITPLITVTYQPLLDNLADDFDFENLTEITKGAAYNPGGPGSFNITQITGKNGNIAAQSNTDLQPILYPQAGPTLRGVGFFYNLYCGRNSVLVSGTDATIFIVRKLYTTEHHSLFYNGGANDGYGYFDGMDNGGFYKSPSVKFGGVAEMAPYGLRTITNKFEAFGCYIPTSGSAAMFNVLGNKYFVFPQAGNFPITPTTGFTIGGGPGDAGVKGWIERVIVYNRKLFDYEIQWVMSYLANRYSLELPINYNAGGDSITDTHDAGVYGNADQALDQILTGGVYMHLKFSAVQGTDSAFALSHLNDLVLSVVKPQTKNVYSLLIGRNDLGNGVSAATIIANIQAIASQVKAVGYKFILIGTLPSTAFTGAILTQYNLLTAAFNADHSYADAYIPAASIPNMSDPTNVTYYSDGTHPTTLGQLQIANTLKPVILSLI